MRKFNKKGFTLVELLVTIVLLGVVATIIIFNMTSVSNQSKESDYAKFIAGIKSAASVYADTNPDVFNDLYVNKAFLYISIEDLVKNGLYDGDTVNPYTEEKVGWDEKIKANLDTTNGQLTFTYPIPENQETETFMVAMSDYIVYGEPGYDCMQGKGTYQLALSEEDGTLIQLDEESIKEYHVTCEMPSDFNKDKEGIYKIKYTWLTKSGTRKSMERELRVLPKVIPQFKTNYEYNFVTKEWFVPRYENGNWIYLKYQPYIEQADEQTVYTIKKVPILPSRGTIETVIENSNDFTKEWPVDDGSVEYTISATIHGHYNTSYSYDAKESYVINSKLIVPESRIFIENNSRYSTTRTVRIKDVWSPVGVSYYEYRVFSSSSQAPSNSAAIGSNKFTYTKNDTVGVAKISDGVSRCTSSPLSYDYLAVRAVNKNGYAGDWTVVNGLNLTNQLDLLIRADCAECTGSNGCTSTGSGLCYFTNKNKYVRFGSKDFNILERFSDGSLLVSYVGTYDSISPISLLHGSQRVQTCNGTYTAEYDYASASTEVIRKAQQGFLKLLPSNYYNYLKFYSWSYGSSYVGNVTLSMVNQYSEALSSSTPYWTTDTTSNSFTVKVPWGAATAYNTYFYYVTGSSTAVGYAGMKAAVKPILRFNTVYACTGNGTSSSPYLIVS